MKTQRTFGAITNVSSNISSRSRPALLPLLFAGALMFLFLGAPSASAQSLSVGTASGTPGTSVDLTVSFTPGATAVSTLQFDLTFPSTLTYVPPAPGDSRETGSAAAAAGKSTSCSAISGGVRVLIFGLNQNAIGSGPVAIVRLNIAAGTPPGTITVGITGIIASDPNGNAVPTSGSPGSVTVTDTTPPVISNVASSGITQTTAIVTWTTDEASDSQVDYGTTTSYGSSTTLNTSMVTSHSQNLTGLATNTLYHYRVRSKDAAGNLALSGDFSFTTTAVPDTTPPVISAVSSSNITANSATISWTTNEASDSQVDYGTTTSYGSSTTLNTSMVTAHSQNVAGLTVGTLYHYRVKSRDASGNLAVSTDFTFTTLGSPDTTPPVISGVSSSNISDTQAMISWTTNEPADSQVEYGTTTDYDSATNVDGTLVTPHVQTLGGLSPDTLYHYRVRSKDASGNLAVSGDFTFTTQPPGSSTTRLTLYCPRPSMHLPGAPITQGDEFTGIALANFEPISPANLTLTAFDISGKKVAGPNITNPAYWILTPRAQLPKLDYQLFCSGSCDVTPIAYVKVESTSTRLDAFYMFFDRDLTVLDGGNISSTPLTDLVLTEIADPGFSKIDLTNPNPDPVQVRFELWSATGGQAKRAALRFVDGSAALSLDVSADLFPDVTPAPGDYIRVTASQGVLSSEMFGKRDIYVNILGAQDVAAAAATLYSPQYVVGGDYRSSLSVVNLDNLADTVSFRLFDKDGILLGGRELAIAPMGKIYITEQDFFGNFGSGVEGYVQITSQQARLAGSVVFGDPGRAKFSSALPLISTLQQAQVFSHVASSSLWWMGIAIVNPGSADASVTLELYKQNGTADGTVIRSIRAGARESMLMIDYFPHLKGIDRTGGYVKLTSSRGVAAFALFGTVNLNVLSAIPAQMVR